MTPLRFRAWHKEDKDMTYDVQNEYRLSELEDRYWIVMQSTGLTGKNGREVFEGDLIRDLNSVGYVAWMGYNKKHTWIGQYVVRNDNEEWCIPLPSSVEVIGNQYENASLLLPQ